MAKSNVLKSLSCIWFFNSVFFGRGRGGAGGRKKLGFLTSNVNLLRFKPLLSEICSFLSIFDDRAYSAVGFDTGRRLLTNFIQSPASQITSSSNSSWNAGVTSLMTSLSKCRLTAKIGWFSWTGKS